MTLGSFATVRRVENARRPFPEAGVGDSRLFHSLGDDRIALIGALGLLLLVQLLVIGAGDSRFSSGSDAGGRAASVAAAVRNGGCDHDLGYWAADADPSGGSHPLVNTERAGDAYVQPTDILYVCAAAAGSSVFGSAFPLLLSVLGVMMAAVGAWSLDRIAGGRGLVSFALVGGLGTVSFYGSDVWEHAPAAGAAILGTALLLGRQGAWSALAGGALWGIAVSLRIETGVVAMAIGAVLIATPQLRRRFLEGWTRTLVFLATGVGVLTADRVLERVVLSSNVRDARAVGGVAAGGGGGGQVGQAASELGQRTSDILLTNIGIVARSDLYTYLLGTIYCLSLLGLALDHVGVRIGRALLGLCSIVTVLVVGLVVVDPGFVPGMLVAAPLSILGAIVAVQRGAQPMVHVAIARAALLALPVIWTFQWTGSLDAQWGGRYQLTSAGLLTVVGVSVLNRHRPSWSGRVLLGAAVAIGAMGLGWHVERTLAIAEVFEEMSELECNGVLISADEFLLREAGGTTEIQSQKIDGCRLLSTTIPQVPQALSIAEREDVRQATIIFRGHGSVDDELFEPWRKLSTVQTSLGRIPVTLVEVDLLG